MPAGSTIVREASSGDRERFIEMWRAFVGAKPSEPGNPDMAEINWARATDPAHPLECLLAVNDGVPRGFTLFTELPFTWSAKNVCYLLDIFVDPESRGSGHAQAMIAHLVALGRRRGWYKIFWMTEPDNERARRFYDRVAKQMNYVRYDLEVSPP